MNIICEIVAKSLQILHLLTVVVVGEIAINLSSSTKSIVTYYSLPNQLPAASASS